MGYYLEGFLIKYMGNLWTWDINKIQGSAAARCRENAEPKPICMQKKIYSTVTHFS